MIFAQFSKFGKSTCSLLIRICQAAPSIAYNSKKYPTADELVLREVLFPKALNKLKEVK
jgi:hypothetical protein